MSNPGTLFVWMHAGEASFIPAPSKHFSTTAAAYLQFEEHVQGINRFGKSLSVVLGDAHSVRSEHPARTSVRRIGGLRAQQGLKVGDGVLVLRVHLPSTRKSHGSRLSGGESTAIEWRHRMEED